MRFRSVLSRVVALHVVAIAVALVCIPAALYMMVGFEAAALEARSFQQQAEDIVRELRRRADGSWELALSDPVRDIYSRDYGRYRFSISRSLAAQRRPPPL